MRLAKLVLPVVCMLLFSGCGADMFHAARSGDKVRVEKLLSRGDEPNAKDKGGWTPLHWAALEGHSDVVELLIDHGSAVNEATPGLDTALHIAVRNNRDEVVRLLVQSGASLEARNNGGATPLVLAGKYNHLQGVRILLGAGADMKATDFSGKTCTDYAKEHGMTDLVQLLDSERKKREAELIEDINLARQGKPTRHGLQPLSQSAFAEEYKKIFKEIERGRR